MTDTILHHRPRYQPRQARARRDAQGRRHHGRRHRRAGEDRRGCRGRRRHGAGARSRRHPRPGWRRTHERPRPDRRHHRRGVDPGHGEGAHRPLRRGAGAAGARRRLHRRVRGAVARRLREPHRQVGLHRPLRLRCDQPGRGAASHHRGCGHDPLEGRGRHRRRLRGDQAHPHHHRRDQRAEVEDQGRAVRRRQRTAGARTSWSPRSRPPASCRSCSSRRAASPPRPTPR